MKPTIILIAWIACCTVSLAGSILIEAETAQVAPPFTIVTVTNQAPVKAGQAISGNRYIEVAPGSKKPSEGGIAGHARYTFKLKSAGVFHLWARCFWQDGCGNSFTVQFDGQPSFTFGQDATYNTWHWVKAPPRLTFKLAAGTHTLTLFNREDGIRVDQLLLTTDSRYVPVDIEETEP